MYMHFKLYVRSNFLYGVALGFVQIEWLFLQYRCISLIINFF